MKGYLKESLKLLVQSFKDLDWRVTLIILYDILFYTVIYLTFLGFGKYGGFVQNRYANLLTVTQQQILGSTSSELDPIVSGFQGIFAHLIGSLIVMALIIFVARAFFKGMIWLTIGKKEYSHQHMLKFIGLNAIWAVIWVGVLTLFFILAKQSVLAPIVLVIGFVMAHFTHILYTLFTEHRKINTIKMAFSLGIKKIHYLLVPYIFVLIILAIPLLLLSGLSFILRYAPQNILAGVTILVLITYMTWVRTYLYRIVKSL